MLKMSSFNRAATALAVNVAFGISTMCETPTKKTLVEFWHSGDDALSQRLTVAVETAFERSPDFTPSSGKKAGTLIVHIPHNVDWEKKLWRTKALYTVEFSSSEGQELGTESGSCWASDIEKCAARILSGARAAARRMPR